MSVQTDTYILSEHPLLRANGIKLREFLSWWKPAPRLRSPGTKLPGYPQTPRWGVEISPSGAVEGSRGFQPPVRLERRSALGLSGFLFLFWSCWRCRSRGG